MLDFLIDSFQRYLTQPMDPEKKSLNFIFPTKYVIPKSLKFSHGPSKNQIAPKASKFLYGLESFLLLRKSDYVYKVGPGSTSV